MSNDRRKRRDRDGPGIRRGTGSTHLANVLIIVIIIIIVTVNNVDAASPSSSSPTGTIIVKDKAGGSNKVHCWACQGNRQCYSRFMTVKMECDVCFKKVIQQDNKDGQGKMNEGGSVIKGCHQFKEVSNNGWKLGCGFVADFFHHGKDVYLCLCNDRHECNLGPPALLSTSWLLLISLLCVLALSYGDYLLLVRT